jgi:hypothetical protein
MPQTLAAALFLKKSEIYFHLVPGYMYRDASVCPENIAYFAKLRCTCNPEEYKGKISIISVGWGLLIHRYIVTNTLYCLPAFERSITDSIL